MTYRGVEASIMWGYHVAATVRDWTVTKGETGWSLSAAVVSLDDFTVSQRPLKFVATHQGGAWSWPVLTLQNMGASLTGTLGPRK
jgi:hypothetical protein